MITEAYLEQQRLMHEQHTYGNSGKKWASTVVKLAREIRAASVLDYGCGTGALIARVKVQALELDVREFDPAVIGKDDIPVDPADLVTCIDVLEHIEPEKLEEVIAHIRSLTKKMLFAVIATRPAGKKLPDGRNAHLIIENRFWWMARLGKHFAFTREWEQRPGEWCVHLHPK